MEGRRGLKSGSGAVAAAVCAVDLGECWLLSLQYDRETGAESECAPELVEFRMVVSHRHWIARVQRRAMEECLTRKLGHPLSAPLRFAPVSGEQAGPGPAWQGFIKHVCEMSVTAPGVLAHSDVRAQYCRTLIELLLHGVPHN